MTLPDQSNPLDPHPDEPAFFLYHDGGPWLRGTFRCEFDAYVWQEGNRGRRHAGRFFITDREGRKVTLESPRPGSGHAYAILDALASDEERAR